MNEPIKKQPVDELFARKLANLSMPPDERGFARLQARMNQQTQPEKIVFWRTPTFKRSMAAAACLVLVGTLGWYAQSTNPDKPVSDKGQTLASHTAPARPTEQDKVETSEVVAKLGTPSERIEKPVQTADKDVMQAGNTEKPAIELALATRPKTNKLQPGPIKTTTTPVNDVTERKSSDEQVAAVAPALVKDNVTSTSATTAPRTLVVTIAEPDVLVAAKQTAQEADQKIVVVNKNTNETGAGKLWRKIQQIRTGETGIADAPIDEDEKGLLDRAYGQLKHSFQKNKPARQ